jgi:hypothetical protein
VAAITPLGGEPVWATDTKVLTIGDGLTLGGVPVGLSDRSTYVVCQPGDDFKAKYATAKTLSPNGSAKSATNRATLLVFPGSYAMGSTALDVDEEFVDIVGLGALRVRRGCVPAVRLTSSTGGHLNVTANDVRIYGIRTQQKIDVASDKPLQVFECCRAEATNAWQAAIVSGTFIHCQGSSGAFAGGGASQDASGTFVSCQAGSGFGGGFASGQGGVASGTFIDCDGTFGSATCSGTFWHCEGAFAPSGNLSGKLYYCRKTSGTTFKALTAPGAIRFCIDGAGDARADLNP